MDCSIASSLKRSRPDGFRRGRSLAPDDDIVGPAIYSEDEEDRYSSIATALNAVAEHPLVREFGFAPDALCTRINCDHYVAMDEDILAVVFLACSAARELSRLSDRKEVCMLLGWEAEPPEALKAFGVDRLFKGAAVLQARIEEIKAEEEKERDRREEQARQTAARKGGIKPRASSTAPQSAPAAGPLLPIPKEMPEGADWLGRVSTEHGLAYRCTCGCGVLVLEMDAVVPPFEVMRERQNGERVRSVDCWKHAFARGCAGRRPAYSLVQTQRRMFASEQEYTRLQEANRRSRHAPPRWQKDTSSGPKPRIGKTARDKAHKGRRAS